MTSSVMLSYNFLRRKMFIRFTRLPGEGETVLYSRKQEKRLLKTTESSSTLQMSVSRGHTSSQVGFPTHSWQYLAVKNESSTFIVTETIVNKTLYAILHLKN